MYFKKNKEFLLWKTNRLVADSRYRSNVFNKDEKSEVFMKGN